MPLTVLCRRTWLFLLPGFWFSLTPVFPSLAADQGAKSGPNGAEAAGMYSNYADDGRVVYDKYPAESGALTEAQLLPALMSALDQLSKYPRPAAAPEIRRVPPEKIQEMACAGKCGALATYRPGEGIYLDERLEPETNLFDRSILLHELVHYAQDMSNEWGDMQPCQRWYHREIEAYAIQKTFLILVGSPVRVGYSASVAACDAAEDAGAAKSRGR